MASDVAILVVDDRPANLLAMETILASEHCDVVRATSGAEALRCILEQDFAVMLIDVLMPGMNGFEVAELIKQRERSRHTPIIFLSASGANLDFIYRAYSVGAVDYLPKPIDADVLRAKVRVFVELRRKDRCIQEQAAALRAAERRERELELVAIRAANEQRYRNLAEAIPQIVWTASADGMITYFNRWWYEYTGQRPEDAAPWLTVLGRTSVDAFAAGWRQGIAGGNVFELECQLGRRDGALRWHLCRAVPERSADGGIVAWLGTMTDCDDLKRTCEMSARAVRARDEFMSIASHELRTPLTTLQLRLRSLQGDLTGGRLDMMPRKLDSCLRQGSRLVNLVEGLFDFSSITSGRLELKRARFDLTEAARDAVEHLAELAAQVGVEVRIEGSGVVDGYWDRLRIEQVIENLLSNAVKYASSGPITITVRATPDAARIEVTDRGPGIASDDLGRIFGAFERASSSMSYAGLGLGLFIAREYTTAHGGTIEVTSVPGEHTTFTVALPRQLDGAKGVV